MPQTKCNNSTQPHTSIYRHAFTNVNKKRHERGGKSHAQMVLCTHACVSEWVCNVIVCCVAAGVLLFSLACQLACSVSSDVCSAVCVCLLHICTLRYDISSTIHISLRVAYFEWYAVAVIVAVAFVICFSRFICRLLLALQLHRLNPKYECDSDL